MEHGLCLRVIMSEARETLRHRMARSVGRSGQVGRLGSTCGHIPRVEQKVLSGSGFETVSTMGFERQSKFKKMNFAYDRWQGGKERFGNGRRSKVGVASKIHRVGGGRRIGQLAPWCELNWFRV